MDYVHVRLFYITRAQQPGGSVKQHVFFACRLNRQHSNKVDRLAPLIATQPLLLNASNFARRFLSVSSVLQRKNCIVTLFGKVTRYGQSSAKGAEYSILPKCLRLCCDVTIQPNLLKLGTKVALDHVYWRAKFQALLHGGSHATGISKRRKWRFRRSFLPAADNFRELDAVGWKDIGEGC